MFDAMTIKKSITEVDVDLPKNETFRVHQRVSQRKITFRQSQKPEMCEFIEIVTTSEAFSYGHMLLA